MFYAFLNRLKEYNIQLEHPKYSPNALEELNRYLHNFDIENIERIVITQNNPHHWLQADILQIQNFLYHYFKEITLNEQTIPQTKVISLFLRKPFRFNYQLLCSQQDHPAFEAFHNHFTAAECLPFIINERKKHPYFFRPETITQQTIDLIYFDPRLNTENNFLDDKRPYRYEQNNQEQQNIITTIGNNNEDDDNNDEEDMLENQNENHNEDNVRYTNENNTSKNTTPESTTSTQNISQPGTSTKTQSVRIPTRIVSQNRQDPQPYLNTSSKRNITFNLPSNTDEIVRDETQDTNSNRENSVDVLSPTRTIFLIIYEMQRELYMTLHQFLLLSSSQLEKVYWKIIKIIPSKLLINTIIHLIIPFSHHLLQIFKQTILKLFLNLTIIQIQ